MKRLLAIFISSISLLILATGCGTSSSTNHSATKSSGAISSKTFTIGVIPQQTKGRMKPAMNKLQTILQKKLQEPVKITVYPDYNGVVEAMNYHKVDMAYFGPLSFVIANQQSGAKAIVAELINGQPYYQSYIITRKNSGIKSLTDLQQKAGKISFAFGDPDSTSGCLYPSMELKKLGLFTDKNHNSFKHVIYTGSHDATALAVKQGSAQAGGIDSVVFGILEKKGVIKASDFRVLWKSKKLYEYPWAVQKDTSSATIKRIQDAFLSIKDPTILNAFGASGFTKATDSDFNDIKKAAESMGRLKK